jgi:hypothetical protein
VELKIGYKLMRCKVATQNTPIASVNLHESSNAGGNIAKKKKYNGGGI